MDRAAIVLAWLLGVRSSIRAAHPHGFPVDCPQVLRH
jgi:hypothetical protein